MDFENISLGDEKKIKEIIDNYNKKIVFPRQKKKINKIISHISLWIYSIFLIYSFYYIEHFNYLHSFVLLPFVLGIGVFLFYIINVFNNYEEK